MIQLKCIAHKKKSIKIVSKKTINANVQFWIKKKKRLTLYPDWTYSTVILRTDHYSEPKVQHSRVTAQRLFTKFDSATWWWSAASMRENTNWILMGARIMRKEMIELYYDILIVVHFKGGYMISMYKYSYFINIFFDVQICIFHMHIRTRDLFSVSKAH